MFTGIIEEIGVVKSVKKSHHSAELIIQAEKVLQGIHTGDSIAVNGVCLTVTAFTNRDFQADVMPETIKSSALAHLRQGSRVNLEWAMPAEGRFGGHMVSGHINGTGVISMVEKDANAVKYNIRADSGILHYIVRKGSIAIDGTSLTVVSVSEIDFCVSVIPHTLKMTVLGEKMTGDMVNLENDCIAKYIEKMLGVPAEEQGITKAYLEKFGYGGGLQDKEV